jgi:hypothetical protein
LGVDRSPCGSGGLDVKVRGAQPNTTPETLDFLDQNPKRKPITNEVRGEMVRSQGLGADSQLGQDEPASG